MCVFTTVPNNTSVSTCDNRKLKLYFLFPKIWLYGWVYIVGNFSIQKLHPEIICFGFIALIKSIGLRFVLRCEEKQSSVATTRETGSRRHATTPPPAIVWGGGGSGGVCGCRHRNNTNNTAGNKPDKNRNRKKQTFAQDACDLLWFLIKPVN